MIISAFFEALLSIIYYSWRNNSSTFTGGYLFMFTGTLRLFRVTFSRILTLMVSLGFQIVIKSVEKYANKIITICFLFMVSLCFNWVVQHRNYEHPMLPIILRLSQVPLLIVSAILFLWIFIAFRRTLAHLKTKRQDYKYQIIYKIYKAFVICTIFGTLTWLIGIIINSSWRSTGYWANSGFIVDSVFLVVLMCVL